MACGDNTRRQGPADSGPDAPPDASLEVPPCAPSAGSATRLRRLVKLSGVPVLVTSAPSDPRLFVVMQDGRILVIKDGRVLATPFLDLSAEAGGPVLDGVERGLLGLAFHPRYATNHRFYVFYTTASSNVLAQYTAASGDADRADPLSGETLISISDPYANHNGGMIAFGPDGFLYVGTGDGGGGNDPLNAGQTPTHLLGKFLRIDVDHPAAPRLYGIPAGNPFADGVGGAPEVFMLGLRNPWRWSFDGNGDLYIGDVGQDGFEELTIVPAGTGAGRNLGWRLYEARECTTGNTCSPAGMTFPQVEVAHTAPGTGWCSIIGGAVYRGSCFPDLVGRYFYTDHCAGGLHSLRGQGGVVLDRRSELLDLAQQATSLHDAGGELYLTVYDGTVYRVEATP